MDVCMAVCICYIEISTQEYYTDQIFRDLLVAGSVLNWLVSFVKTQIFSTLQFGIFPFQLRD